MKGGRQSGGGGEEGEGEKKIKTPSFAPIKAGGGGQRVSLSVVALTPGSGGDRRVVYANEDGALSRAPSVSVSRERGEDVGEGPRGS